MEKRKHNIMYRIGHASTRLITQVFYKGESYGIHWAPKSGPFLLASNHQSFLDPFISGCFLKRDIYYFARKSLFKPGFRNWILKQFNSIPVDLSSDSDISALKTALKILHSGEGLLVFPEGTRSDNGSLKQAKRGVGMMACKNQVPVVPMRIYGSFEIWGKNRKFPNSTGKISVVYGKPLIPQNYDPGEKNSDRYQIAADRIMAAIASLEIPEIKLI